LTMSGHLRQRGSTMVEFVLTGIPLMFAVISIVQMSIGMWHYHTLQYAVKEAGAYLSIHGASSGYCRSNTCQIQNVASVLQTDAIGIPSNSIYVTFTPISSSDHATAGASYSCRLDNCVTDTTTWPISGYNSVGSEFAILAKYQFKNAMGMVAPGAGGGAVKFGNPWFPGYTHQIIQY
jgi:Flp pilus assembly protein TadG